MKLNPSSYTEEQLVELLAGSKRDSEAAFKELYQRFSSKVHAYCVKIIGDEDAAEDIYQDTFIRFYKNIRNDTEKTRNVSAYIFTIARNLCLNYNRDKKNTVPIENLEYLIQERQDYENKELLDLITRSLELLEEEYREAFVLKEYSGLNYKEIAKVLNTTVVNARSRVFRAKKKIKEILQPYLNDIEKL